MKAISHAQALRAAEAGMRAIGIEEDDFENRLAAAVPIVTMDYGNVEQIPGLSPQQTGLVLLLIAARGHVVPYNNVSAVMLGESVEPRTMMAQLVSQIRKFSQRKDWIATVGKAGYSWTGPDEAEVRRIMEARWGAAQ